MQPLARLAFAALALLGAASFVHSQPAAPAADPNAWTAAQDHADMMRQLGITQIRPGPSGRTGPDVTNPANYDPAKANPFPDLPELRVAKNGAKISTAEQWWSVRRPEIVEEFEREIVGRVPANAPKINWEITKTVVTEVGGIPVIAKQVIGHADNSAHPTIAVAIRMAVVVPANAPGRVPVLMMFGGGLMPGEQPQFGRGGFGGAAAKKGDGKAAPEAPKKAAPVFADPPSTEQLIAAGWGYVSISTTSIQADNGAGLTKGIIGLANKGQPRTPEQWGALRAWAWGAARALDFLEDGSRGRRQARRYRGCVALRQGRARHDGLRATRFKPSRWSASSGEGGVKLAPPRLRRGRREPCQLRRSITGWAAIS